MPTALIGPALGLVGAIGGAAVSSSAAKKASKAATEAAEKNNALQREMYTTTRADLQPYTQAGYRTTNALLGYLGLNDGGSAPQRMPNFTGRPQPVRYTPARPPQPQPQMGAQPMGAAQPSMGGQAGMGEMPPLSALQEGHVTTFGNGQKWVLQGGQPQRVG